MEHLQRPMASTEVARKISEATKPRKRRPKKVTPGSPWFVNGKFVFFLDHFDRSTLEQSDAPAPTSLFSIDLFLFFHSHPLNEEQKPQPQSWPSPTSKLPPCQAAALLKGAEEAVAKLKAKARLVDLYNLILPIAVSPLFMSHTQIERERAIHLYIYIYTIYCTHTHTYIYKYDSLQYIRHCTHTVWSGLVSSRLVLSLSLSLCLPLYVPCR